jgi:hypothetical protein
MAISLDVNIEDVMLYSKIVVSLAVHVEELRVR